MNIRLTAPVPSDADSIQQAKRTIATAKHAEVKQALVDAMVAPWDMLESGSYGFTGYDRTNTFVNCLDNDELVIVADCIVDRRMDMQA